MKLSVLANPDKYSIKAPLNNTVRWCLENGHDLHIQDKLGNHFTDLVDSPLIHLFDKEEDCIEGTDFVIAIGGDGTLLHSAQIVKKSGIPILGINTGKLGFMANVQPDKTENALQDLVDNKFRIDERALLKATSDNGMSCFALNELLFTKKDTSSLITLNAFYDGELLNRFWVDGLIVATPTGSTAYNLSAGGPIVMPGTPIMIVTPINPHTLTTRPLIIPANKSLVIKIEDDSEHILFSYDGKTFNGDINEVEITQSDFTVKLVQLLDQTYFKTLRSKLMWGLDNRQKSE